MIILYISGIDGCGKTTQSNLLVDWLRQSGRSAEYQWLRWEPSVLPVIRRFRSMFTRTKRDEPVHTTSSQTTENRAHGSWRRLKSRLMSSALFRTFWMKYATRDYHVAYEKARRHWTSDFVVMDRYLMDFVIDQSLNFDLTPDEFLKATQSTRLNKLQRPQFSVFINIKAATGYHRKQDGTPLQYLEERENLYNSFKDDSILHVNGEQSPELIHSTITDWLARKLDIGHEK